jgi:phenylalanyl-tRNA synthetase beta chain
LAHNINRRQKDLKLFEFGKTYHKKGAKYIEKRHLALYTSGLQDGETWAQAAQKSQLHHLYTTVINTMKQLGVRNLKPRLSKIQMYLLTVYNFGQ